MHTYSHAPNLASRNWLRLGVCVVAFLLSGCFPPDDGIDAPLDRIYFPVGLELNATGSRLYIANSNFDLQFNAGTLQALDTEAIRDALPVHCLSDADCATAGARSECEQPEDNAAGLCIDRASGSPCGALGLQDEADQLLVPGACEPLPLTAGSEPVLLDSVRIGPFVTDLVYRRRARGGRLYLPVRGDATLHWVDVEAGQELDCDRGGDDECSPDHRRGDEDNELTANGDTLPTEPSAIAVGGTEKGVVRAGDPILVTHQTEGTLSLFVETESGPELRDVLGGVATDPIGVTPLPIPRLARAEGVNYQPGFLVTYRHFRGSPTIDLVRYFDEQAADPAEPYLQPARSIAITTSRGGRDARSIAVDDSERVACEASCDSDGACVDDDADVPGSDSCLACVTDCAALPLQTYVVNRDPPALLIGQNRPSRSALLRDDLPNVSDVVPLRGGPSRMQLGKVIVGRDDAGKPMLETRVLVLAFDNRTITIYNPKTGLVEARTTTGRGPHALAIDERRGLGYVAHFTDSYIGVLDLDRTHSTYGQLILSVGEPSPPRSSQSDL